MSGKVSMTYFSQMVSSVELMSENDNRFCLVDAFYILWNSYHMWIAIN